MTNDLVYFSRRAQEEREAAMKAAHPAARRAHVDLAEAYDRCAGLPEWRERWSRADLVSAGY